MLFRSVERLEAKGLEKIKTRDVEEFVKLYVCINFAHKEKLSPGTSEPDCYYYKKRLYPTPCLFRIKNQADSCSFTGDNKNDNQNDRS